MATPRSRTSEPIQSDSRTTPASDPGTPPLEGVTRLRVRYAECDPMGVAHHASYLPWLEIARTELLRDAGRTYRAMEAEGLFLVITRAEVKYRRPIRYDDLLDIRVKADLSSPVRIRHAYEVALIERDATSIGELDPQQDPSLPRDGVCAVGVTELACVGSEGRPVELPAWLRQARPHDRPADG